MNARPAMSLLIRGGLLVTMNDRFDVVEGDVSVRDGLIAAVGAVPEAPHDRVIDARGGFVLPGFIQTHLHLCQTLFRGLADDLPLMEWLRRRVWPLEAAHTDASLTASAELAAVELLAGGTTSVLTMETVHGTDAVCYAIAGSGLRATIGKCMMDAAGGAPSRLHETTAAALDESLALARRWDGAAEGRIRIAFAPRFAVSCTRELLEGVAAASADRNMLVHTHASESQAEIAIVRELSGGATNIEYLTRLNLASPRLCAAHCVWVDERERALIEEHDVKVMHCPSSNLKLGSGLAPIVELRARGVTVSLGADGAACNNRLDMFEEMRLAAMVQAVRLEPGALTARDAVWMATRGGARTLGLDHEIGSLEPGKRADLIVLDRDGVHQLPGDDPYSTIVYACRPTDVRFTLVDGRVLVDEFTPLHLDRARIGAAARETARLLVSRAGISS